MGDWLFPCKQSRWRWVCGFLVCCVVTVGKMGLEPSPTEMLHPIIPQSSRSRRHFDCLSSLPPTPHGQANAALVQVRLHITPGRGLW